MLRQVTQEIRREQTFVAERKPCIPGYRANGIAVGIKDGVKKDCALIVSDVPAQVSAVFTTNSFKAAPVIIDEQRVADGTARVIIINSGNANAATGAQGREDACAITAAVAARLGIDEDEVLIASTGVIGQRLPVSRIIDGIDPLVAGLCEDGIADAEEAIMTTDRFPKIEVREVTVGAVPVTVCGIVKGAGMIEPNMATMLSFILTDACIEKSCMDRIFRKTVDVSFNAISVDGCMSTNDTVIMMANGVAGNEEINDDSPFLSVFEEVLCDVMMKLAKAIVRDGEGATKVIAIEVCDAATEEEARSIAYAVARSNLIKTAFFGNDANWGRIIAAVGAAGYDIDPDRVSVIVDDTVLFRQGSGVPGSDEVLEASMKKDEIAVRILLMRGNNSFRMYASDLSLDYVTVNAHYRT